MQLVCALLCLLGSASGLQIGLSAINNAPVVRSYTASVSVSNPRCVLKMQEAQEESKAPSQNATASMGTAPPPLRTGGTQNMGSPDWGGLAMGLLGLIIGLGGVVGLKIPGLDL